MSDQTSNTPTAEARRGRHRRIVVDEIRDTGPLHTGDLLRRLEGAMPRREVLQDVSDAETTGEIRLDVLGRFHANKDAETEEESA